MKLYKTIGELLREYRTSLKLTQLDFLNYLTNGKPNILDIKTYRRWELNKNKINDENTYFLSERTQIPLEVIFRLNNKYPTLYNLYTHIYTHCPYDSDFINRKVAREELWKTDHQGNIDHLHKPHIFKKLIKYDFPFYPQINNLNSELVYVSIKHLPEINLLAMDPVNFYGGHIICLALKLDIFEKLLEREVSETDLDIEHFDSTKTLHSPILLHILSFHATNSTHAYSLLRRLAMFFFFKTNTWLSKDSVVTRYSVTREGNELCKKIGFKGGFSAPELSKKEGNLPTFWYNRLDELDFWKKI